MKLKGFLFLAAKTLILYLFIGNVLLQRNIQAQTSPHFEDEKCGMSAIKNAQRVYHSFYFFDPILVLLENLIIEPQHPLIHSSFMTEDEIVNFELKEPEFYNINGEYPYDGYFAAREIFRKDSPFDLKTILRAHQAMLSKKSITLKHQNNFSLKKIPLQNSED